MITELQQDQQHEEPEQELALADLDLPEKSAGDVTGGRLDLRSGKAAARGGVRGGCDDWGCGSNHNEVLAVTA